MSDIKFEIKKPLGVISTNPKSSWSKEINLVSWNGNEAKVDIREWNGEHTSCSKGITLTKSEALILADLIKSALPQ